MLVLIVSSVPALDDIHSKESPKAGTELTIKTNIKTLKELCEYTQI